MRYFQDLCIKQGVVKIRQLNAILKILLQPSLVAIVTKFKQHSPKFEYCGIHSNGCYTKL